ncbi:MAG TPA: hypothetical protein DDX72_09835 [Ruminococcaceae bacterium]|nr:hypothetical protein [Oscillospiraceae bacterium]
MAAGHKKSISRYFDIPDVSLFTEGNTFTGSENTFNFRIKPDEGSLRARVWYGMKCFELSESEEVCTSPADAEGLASLGEELDAQYEKYLSLVAEGKVAGRRTYTAKKTEN